MSTPPGTSLDGDAIAANARAETLAEAWEKAEWPQEAPVLRAIAMPSDTNPEGDIFGGWLLSQMDLAAASIAFHRAAGRCATIAIDGMTFLSPVFVGDEVSLFAKVVHTGRTSLKVAVEAWRRRRDGEQANKVTEGVFTFVAIDENRKSRPLP
ncbi:acyl-CoA thioesterase [Caulobacter vibrioides]|uniref:Cytosolic long-chain acyl-CoA thioester hydrolase family protein n=1 Tax=Caulobacter vibrioides (strain ATCC 19089 / CIP 103742 / CB 15) TaxID=190650 RepID=Q9ABN6_CAUVC|nr:cytosolic long-chain acyl-CoA thioester hydrolase family protein [Caulobacter vibrioides CB15]ATC23205.1 acyl-CoA thioesterase [Caulobacter vibrioides]ATC27024.1 acyl-CoA thioesterase [Caulobacter vibrioides]AZH14748.1 acyl-CoA thioesterase [Caulobacter vibrioides]PLR13123.1 acyl-CoA thioesterase [Caulobacter vibrioides]